MREKTFPKMLPKVFIDDLKALTTVTLDFSDLLFSLHSCTNKCTDFFSLEAVVVPLCTLHFWSDCNELSGALNHKLMSLETFFSHEYRVIEILKLCTQTGSVRNGWKFLVAK